MLIKTKASGQRHLRHIVRLAAGMRLAAASGTTNGMMNAMNSLYLRRCTVKDDVTGSVIMFSRDTGHHTSGWLKNPDYERCWHMSLSFFDPSNGKSRTYDEELAEQWAQTFFGEHLPKVWVESAKSGAGIQFGVRHYRLFADENWEPILPRGEVYSTELTELGWKSASQVREETGHIVESPVNPN